MTSMHLGIWWSRRFDCLHTSHNSITRSTAAAKQKHVKRQIKKETAAPLSALRRRTHREREASAPPSSFPDTYKVTYVLPPPIREMSTRSPTNLSLLHSQDDGGVTHSVCLPSSRLIYLHSTALTGGGRRERRQATPVSVWRKNKLMSMALASIGYLWFYPQTLVTKSCHPFQNIQGHRHTHTFINSRLFFPPCLAPPLSLSGFFSFLLFSSSLCDSSLTTRKETEQQQNRRR